MVIQCWPIDLPFHVVNSKLADTNHYFLSCICERNVGAIFLREMDPADRVGKAQAAGKIRVSHGGRHRGKPYSRAKVKPAEEADAKKKDDKVLSVNLLQETTIDG